jgi:PKHD-type hydroxylase
MNSIGGPASCPEILGPFVVWEGAFSAEELKAIEHHGGGLPHQDAVVDADSPRYDQNIRTTKVAWIERNPRTENTYDRMETIILSLNSQFFQYNLVKLTPFQHAIYNGSEQAHFDWHSDYCRETGREENDFRKLSITVQLSDPSDYAGGELQARVRSGIDVAPKSRGTVIAFPSFVLHRVTPVTSGVRKSLVGWVLGPDYK